MNELQLPVCALVFSVLLAIVYFTKERIKLVENKIYSIMLIMGILDSLIVVLERILVLNLTIDSMPKYINNILVVTNKLDFAVLIILTTCIFLYTLIISFPKIKEEIKLIAKITGIIDGTFFIIMLFLKVNFISDNNVLSVNGSAILPAYIISGVYLALSVLVTLVNAKNITKRHIPVISILFIFLFLMIIFKYNPYIMIISITVSLVNYLMYFTIENPDMKMIEELETAKSQADKANRAKTDFLSSMSHEIRTPLNAIVGFSDCITNAKALEEAKENAEDIVNASNTLLEIVNGILDISKIESGKLEIINSKYKPKETLEKLAKLITPRIKEKGLDFTYSIAPDLPDTLYGDQASLKKIVTNILSNAAKYTDKGFVRYEVNCINESDNCKLIISVEDSGRGIKKENVDKLFTRFQRLDEDRNTTIEGTGLGLAITKQLVEMMGGQIIVHTIYGEGSKFTIILNQKITESIQVDSREENYNRVDISSAKVLLVDDNELNLKVAKKLLDRLNVHNVDAVNSGFACIDKIASHETYDIILLDDMMPKMRGTETLEKLKEIEGFDIPVIALTANAITGMKEKYLNLGFTNYLSKPIEKEELSDILIQILSKKNISLSKDNANIEESEKIETKQEEISEESKEKSNMYNEEYLKNHNVDLDKAIDLLGDMEMYNETVHDFLEKIDERFVDLENYKKSDDMENYAVEVHALKSDCKYLGFTKLAQIAYEHELKSKDNDITFINNHYQELLNAKEELLEFIKPYAENN